MSAAAVLFPSASSSKLSSASAWLASSCKGKRSTAVLAAIKAKKAALSFTLPKALPSFKPFRSPLPIVKAAARDTSPGLAAAMLFRQRMLQAVEHANASLVLTTDGCGGVYLVQQDSTSVAVFKPRDEEYMAPANPRGHCCPNAVVGETPHPAKKGFRVGDGAMREVAAYLLDAAYDHFSGVPTTHFVSLPVRGAYKEGSIQSFMPSESTADDVGTLRFGAPDVHKIAILDVRLFNTDRHGGNILLQPTPGVSTYAMVPIDHGLCLPSIHHLDAACFEWLYWPQAKIPLNDAALNHIAALDDAKDAAALRSVGLDEEAIATMRVCTKLLQKGAAAGFSLYDIGSVLQRDGAGLAPSKMELLVEDAFTRHADVSSAAFLAHVDAAIDALWEQADKCKGRSMSGLY
ncbi:Aste57867_13796 [Aphanomyces stellatus]|uniref:Aste57867_13796 protein n=1 Tax=Aphanomyces stellatus TaxID=120398 RepID=A0A485KZE8_9STRA|nr:hypothetical protein As57867_013746 [Aphanomyces stellatus]VFT90628.1 Aste57867_13796 [Aphanomyces stellatus]